LGRPLVVSHRNTKAPFLLHRGASFRRTGNRSSDVALLVYCILFQDVLHIRSKPCNKKRHHTNCSTKGETPMTMAAASSATAKASERTRWLNLVFCIICMIMIANLQYGWTLFVNPINKAHGWSIASIQVAFAVFIALETWLTPIEGWIADMIGPKIVIAFGGIMVGIGWVINAYAGSLEMLYFGAVVGGIGGGAVYATSVGQAVKWFPDRRGLAVGLTAAGYGAGAALTVIPIRHVIEVYGYQAAFLWFGIV